MRSSEERIRLIHTRTAELRRKQRQKKQFLTTAASVAACLVLVVGLGFTMPELMQSISETNVAHTSGTASLVGSHLYLGYILIGILSFLLGMSVTTLLYRLHLHQKQKDEEPFYQKNE